MAMIRCSECGKDISDKAATCIGCGAPTSPSRLLGDLDGDGRITFADLRIALERTRDSVASATEALVSQGAGLIRSNDPPGKAGPVSSSFPNPEQATQSASTESTEACQKFQAALRSTIDIKFAEIMKGKPAGAAFLTYVDAQILTASVRNVFSHALGIVPPQIESACLLSEAILSPSSAETQRLIKAAAGIGGGAAGIAMVISGAAAALGWGAGVVASVTAFFVGTSMVGPIGWMVAGISLAGVAAYFATTSNAQIDTERFMKVLSNSLSSAVIAVWAIHGPALSKVLDRETAR